MPKNATPKEVPSSGIVLARIFLVLAIAAGLGFAGFTWIRHKLIEVARSEATHNIRSFKLACDAFAMDNNGAYPNSDTAVFYELPDPDWSNDFFRQLHASRSTSSERLFWVPRSQVCLPEPPDDLTTHNGRFAPGETLQAGDNHWAYITDLTNVDHPGRPIIIDSYLPGTTSFDRRLWLGKGLVIRVDSSAIPLPIARDGTLRDQHGRDLLAPSHPLWAGTPPNLRQPDPHP